MKTNKIFILLTLIMSGGQVYSSELWSTRESFQGTGYFYGPGSYAEKQELFDLVIHNLSFITGKNFITPFFNNGSLEPNICAEYETSEQAQGMLSNGILINENIDMCTATIAGTDILMAVVKDGLHQGEQFNVSLDSGELMVSMDVAIDLGIGKNGVIKIPFYGTTGSVTIPKSLQSQNDLPAGIDRAGTLKSGEKLKGRLGDFNNDGWIDGTLVSAGNLPLNSPIYPGQPYAMLRNFETNIPVEGQTFGNVKALHNRQEH